MTRYRGVVIPPVHFYPNVGRIQELLDWNVNLVRLHIIDSAYYSAADGVASALQILENARKTDKEGRLKFIVNIGYKDRNHDYALHLKFWQQFLSAFDAYDSVIGYDVVNEPKTMSTSDIANPWPWLDTMPTFHQAMRGMTDKILMFQSGHWGTDSGFQFLEPLGDPNCWHGCNLYSTQTFTHQGIGNYPTPVEWPSYRNHPWDIVDEKQHLIRWCQEHPNETVYIPEIGVSGMADLDSANAWANDAINLIEAIGCHASAHSYPQRPKHDNPDYPLFHMPLARYREWWALNGEDV